MYHLIDWAAKDSAIIFDEDKQSMLFSKNNRTQATYECTDLNRFIEASDNFPVKFPIESSRCRLLRENVSESTLLRNINSAYPVLHELVIPLFVNFILHKRQFGSNIEKKFYKHMNFLDLVDKLLTKRSVEFVDWEDYYMLLDGTTGSGGWENVGKDNQDNVLTLENCLSYDEIKLSAFLSVSSYTYFINDGRRSNVGVPAFNRENLQCEGIIIGLIGPRMAKEYCMEYQDIIVEDEQNHEGNGYGTSLAPTMASLFSSFYEKPNWTYGNFLKTEERERSGHFTRVGNEVYFDNVTYSKRITLSIDTLLFEANQRAKDREISAYVHVVGIGLGAWIISNHQKDVFLETFARRVEYMGNYLHNISDLHFAYFFLAKTCGKYKDGSIIPIKGHPNGGIRIFISNRQPHEALVGDNKGKLLVVSYAWDANALPGNEYWNGSLGSSSDPAAACSTQVAEIHNPHINRNVSASNLRIASKGNVYPYEEYVQKVLAENKARSSKSK